MWFAFLLPGLARKEVGNSTSTKKQVLCVCNSVADITYILRMEKNLQHVQSIRVKHSSLRAKTHLYYKVGFFGVFLINCHNKNNINPVLGLLQEKKYKCNLSFLTVSHISNAFKSAASSGLLSFCHGRSILDSCKSFVSYLSQNPLANSRNLIRAAILMEHIECSV